MNKVKKVIILIIILILFLFALHNDAFAGGGGDYMPQQGPPSTIEIIQPEPNIALEVGKWAGGIITVGFAAWLTYYLNKKKKND